MAINGLIGWLRSLGRRSPKPKPPQPEEKPADIVERVWEHRQPESDETTLVFGAAEYLGDLHSAVLWVDGHVTAHDGLSLIERSRRILIEWQFDSNKRNNTHADFQRLDRQFLAAIERILDELGAQGWQVTARSRINARPYAQVPGWTTTQVIYLERNRLE